ncbi:MAG: precorrin-2 C(20)-methyltransferase [Microlunatus sp.]|nr:precorrin-2 C(20)-methyltransferase [Microlunatus sp.]MDN5769874.1 precorrin-2 C(20)-methyltransferase [Microlunatus sp.]
MTPNGTLYAVGVGPGDPELLTVKAARLIAAADVVAYHSGPRGDSIARSIVADHIPAGAVEELLAYPVTVGRTEGASNYYAQLDAFYDTSADRLSAHLDAGRNVVVLAEGDPLFYSSYMYLHDRLADRFTCEIVPGVTSVSASTAAAGLPLTRHEDVLTVLPGTLSVPELARRLANTEAAVIMKLGRTFAGVREALRQAGRLADAVYVERASTGLQIVRPVSEVDAGSVPYFSSIVVPGHDRREDSAGRADTATPTPIPADTTTAELLVLGLGPGPDRWVTPEVTDALACVDHVVGYGPYVDRVPPRPGLQRHASGNTVELDRARLALDLALAGEKVALVSGGDAGVFGMASAAFEAATADERYAGVGVTVLPAVTAAQAVAAQAGAPLGGDYVVLSLSNRLKSWDLIERRLRAAATAELVIAIYNPASRSRTSQVARARDLLLEYRSGETAVIVGRDVGRQGEDVLVTTLQALDPTVVDMRCLVIIGTDQTSVVDDRVWTRRSEARVVSAGDRSGDHGR